MREGASMIHEKILVIVDAEEQFYYMKSVFRSFLQCLRPPPSGFFSQNRPGQTVQTYVLLDVFYLSIRKIPVNIRKIPDINKIHRSSS